MKLLLTPSLALLLLPLAACRPVPEVCSPAARAVVDEVCVQAMAQALLKCETSSVDDCPTAKDLASACRVTMVVQQEGCAR